MMTIYTMTQARVPWSLLNKKCFFHLAVSPGHRCTAWRDTTLHHYEARLGVAAVGRDWPPRRVEEPGEAHSPALRSRASRGTQPGQGVSGVTPEEQAAAWGATEESEKVADGQGMGEEREREGRRLQGGKKDTGRSWKRLAQTAQRSCSAHPNGTSNLPSTWRPILKGSLSVQSSREPC